MIPARGLQVSKTRSIALENDDEMLPSVEAGSTLFSATGRGYATSTIHEV